MRIVVTGSLGLLGAPLVTHLAAMGHDVTGLDQQPAEESVRTYPADLSRFDAAWTDLVAGHDAIVHLAASGHPRSPFEAVIPNNVDATLNVFEAARRGGVKRVIVASSNWVLAGHRFDGSKLGAETSPEPVGAYGISKLMCERIGAHFAEAHGMSVISARIGWVQRTHDNIPGAHMAMGRWGQLMWLSDRDFLDAMTAAVTVPVDGFNIVNLVSNNPGMRWSLEEARTVLSWTPQDGAPARLPLAVKLRETGAWVRHVVMPRLSARIVRDNW